MSRTGGRGRLPWSASSIRLRLLAGLAGLLVAGLIGSSVAGGFFLDDFLDDGYRSTLLVNAEKFRALLATGPLTVDGDQMEALVGTPLGVVGVDTADRDLFSTDTEGIDTADVISVTAGLPAGRVGKHDSEDNGKDGGGKDSLIALRLPSPGLAVTWAHTEDNSRPAALILYIDTSINDAKVASLVKRQLTLVATALVVLLGLAVVVLRLGMRPLAQMARTADAIAAGSRQERLPTRGDRSETDQLALAVNNAFDAQARAEATVRSFAADASHELRTPLATISGWLDLYHQGGITGSGLETALEHIDVEAGRMRLLVEELALLARLDAGRPLDQDVVDLSALAADIVNDAQIIYPDRDVTLLSPGPMPVRGDCPRLQQVLRNLVGNAVQHTPGDRAVRVELTTGRGSAGGEKGESTVELRVIDNGPGIAAEDLPRVFERFWRAESSRSREYGGSGLGLAIVEAITHAHHGRVVVESVVGSGTTVTLSLPRVVDQPVVDIVGA